MEDDRSPPVDERWRRLYDEGVTFIWLLFGDGER